MSLGHLIAEFEAADSLEQLQAAMNRAISALEIPAYVFVHRNEQSREHVILAGVGGQAVDPQSSTSAWFDVVVARAADENLPFFWVTADLPCASDKNLDRVLHDPLHGRDVDLEVSYGWTVPVHDAAGRTAVMSFIGSRDLDRFKLTIELHRATLHAMTIYFQVYVCRMTRLQASVPAFELTPRERQCLEWAARGKSRSDIGQIMGLSPRTVKFHLENAQRKLNVARTTQAVLRAVSLGLIAVTE
ncbi:MAG TPA: LuxR C-terminal-related transcriptional regulator [Kofleriaceae bacterium]